MSTKQIVLAGSAALAFAINVFLKRSGVKLEEKQEEKKVVKQEAKKVELTLRPLNKSFKCVLFDMDGTLIETKKIWYHLLSSAVKEFKQKEFTYEEWEPTFGQSMAKNVELWMHNQVSLEALTDFCNKNYFRYIEYLEVLPGAVELLDLTYSRTGGNIGLVTNCPPEILWPLVQRCNFGKYFNSTNVMYPGVHDGKTIHSKPDPAGIQLMLTRLKSAKEETLFIGDSKFDAQAARSAGVTMLGIGCDGEVQVKETHECVPLFD